jgi:hypothetical protein
MRGFPFPTSETFTMNANRQSYGRAGLALLRARVRFVS